MWSFYYDEAFHDRGITITDDEVNIYKENASDIYTGFFCGYEDTKKTDIWGKYENLEKNYSQKFTIPENKELKATTIKRKNYIFGFASFIKLTIEFYEDFFDILNDSEVIFHISMFSKTELIVQEFLCNLSFPKPFNQKTETITYILTKFLFNYKNQEIIKGIMFANSNLKIAEVINQLKNYISMVIEYCSSKKTKAERNALGEMLILLNNVKISDDRSPELNWRYNSIFIGFNKLLIERSILPQNIELTIDREERTYAAAKAVGHYSKCEQGESDECIGIRISDFLSHFFGSLAVALTQALDEGEIKSKNDLIQRDFENKKLLPQKWFSVSEEQFNLWKKIEDIFYNYQLYKWTGYDGVYCDIPALVFAYLEYVNLYDDYETFKKIPATNHCEYFNTYSCEKLEELYHRAGTRLADY